MEDTPIEVINAWANIDHGQPTTVDYRVIVDYYDNSFFENGVYIYFVDNYEINRDKKVVERILAAIHRAGGNCPCVPSTTWSRDTMCPCKFYREGNGCHCGLYVERIPSWQKSK